MFIKDGNRINVDAPFTDPVTGVKGIRLTDPAERERYGITEIAEPERKDESFYYVQQLDEAPYVLNTPKPLEQIKPMFRAKVNAIRDAKERVGFPYLGKWFDSDEKSFYRIVSANAFASLASEDFTRDWVLADNTTITLDKSQLLGLLPALTAYGSGIFDTAKQLKEEIDLATFEQLESLDVEARWNEIFNSVTA